MNLDHPSDLAPLPFGAGLVLGLMLIIALPAEDAKKSGASKPAGSEGSTSIAPAAALPHAIAAASR